MRPATIFACLLVQLAALGCDSSDKSPGPPRIQLLEADRDLGVLLAGGSKLHTVEFSVENVGWNPLKLQRIESSCGCAKVRINKATIRPGGQAKMAVDVELDVPRKRTTTVSLHTNDPITPVASCTIAWEAATPVMLEPSFVNLGTLRPGQESTTVVDVVQHRFDAVPVPDLGSLKCAPASSGSATWQDRGDSMKERLAIRVVASSESGDYRGSVEVPLEGSSLEHFPRGRLAVSLRWTVRDLIEASPKSVFLGSADRGGTVTRSFVVACDPSDNLMVGHIRSDGPSRVETRWKQLKENVVVVNITVQLPDEPGAQQWTLSIQCSAPAPRVLQVRLSAFVRDSGNG